MAKPASAIGSETDLLVCPYNESHLILRKRFQVHLIRCRRSHPNAPMIVCPFNVTHRVNKVELEWHVSTCPDRQNFENFRHQDAPIVGLSSTINLTFCGSAAVGNATSLFNNTYNTVATTNNIKGGEYIESSESWDDLPEHPSYNPNEYIEKAEVLRLPVGMTPSERKAFRLAERKRLQSLMK
ncbi:gametocyte-specific factor 1 homolog [Lucilia cuprina]|uniref:gametocyte-specific factor 1 homolog n=1 Tax=Lucilia cuprina TaxID=7375 RepID=UPI001F0603D7|nr:gametocyte-specific factor 1 homolog [Lucilia cuprina]